MTADRLAAILASEAASEQAYRRLRHRLDDLDAARTRWPCRGQADRWFAPEASDRAAAAAACTGCPALTECAAYADLADERWGVWGGRDRTPPSRPVRKETVS